MAAGGGVVAVLEQHRLAVRVSGEEAQGFGAAVAVKTDDSYGGRHGND
jgi:hypothetical protein